jgi:hypothetical protein
LVYHSQSGNFHSCGQLQSGTTAGRQALPGKEQAMFEREETGRGGGFAMGLVVGALLGAVVALAYAPERGDVLRKKVRRRLRDAGESARETLSDTAGELRDEVVRRRRDIARNLGV